MDEFRAVYVVAEDDEYGRWVRRFWKGRSPQDDPLWHLLHPADLRGEVAAWGLWPHWTVLDALTVSNTERFAKIVESVCRLSARPRIEPQRFSIFGRALVVRCTCDLAPKIQLALGMATRHVIARMPLADEEFQRAEWRIRQVGKDVQTNLDALRETRRRYREAGAPPLPSSRHFRLGFLVRLVKELSRATGDEARASKARHLDHFLKYGEPYWYGASGSLHATIASGLNVQDKADRQQQLDRFNDLLWPSVQSMLGAYEPASLAIMAEDPDNPVTVGFFDWLCEEFVEETRPGFQVIGHARFA